MSYDNNDATVIPGCDICVTERLETSSGKRYVKVVQSDRSVWIPVCTLDSSHGFNILKQYGILFPSTKMKNAWKAAVMKQKDYRPGHAFSGPGFYFEGASPVYMTRLGKLIGNLGYEHNAVLFDPVPASDDLGSSRKWEKTIAPLLKDHDELMFLIGAIVTAPILRLSKFDQSALVIEIASKSLKAQELAVLLAASVFGEQNTTRLHASKVDSSMADLLNSSADGVLILEDPHRLPAKQRKNLAFIEDLTRLPSSTTSGGKLGDCPKTVMLIPSTRPLMDDAPKDSRVAKKLRSQFITLKLGGSVSSALCEVEAKIREVCSANSGVVGHAVIEHLVHRLSDESGIADVQSELAKRMAMFKSKARRSQIVEDDERLLTSSAIVYAAARFAKPVWDLGESKEVGPQCLRVYKSLCVSQDVALDALMRVVHSSRGKIQKRKADDKSAIDLTADTLAYRISEGETFVYWFNKGLLKAALGANATQLLKELRDRGIHECERDKLEKTAPTHFGVSQRMCKIVLPKALVNI